MIHCAIYPRKSKMRKDSVSMEMQINECKRYIEAHHEAGKYTIEVYDGDEGVSGHSVKKREDFQRMMEDVRNGRINEVLIYKYDRIARNMYDFINIYHELEENNCSLVSTSQNIDTSTPMGKQMMYQLAGWAEMEWEMISQRYRDNNAEAIRIGKCTFSDSHIPYGYKCVRTDGIRRMVKDEDKEDIVNDAFGYFLLHQNKTKTYEYISGKYENAPTYNTISKMFGNEFYIGKYRDNENFCPAYITKEQHERILEILKNNRSRYRKTHFGEYREYLFSGLIRCPACGGMLTAHSKVYKTKIYTSMRCERHAKKRTTLTCAWKKNVNEELVEQYLLKNMSYLIDREMEFYISLEDKAKKSDAGKKAAALKAKMERLTKAYVAGRMTDDDYDSQYAQAEAELKTIELPKKNTTDFKALKERFSDGFEEAYQGLDKAGKRAFWHGVLKEIVVNMDGTVKRVIFL